MAELLVERESSGANLLAFVELNDKDNLSTFFWHRVNAIVLKSGYFYKEIIAATSSRFVLIATNRRTDATALSCMPNITTLAKKLLTLKHVIFTARTQWNVINKHCLAIGTNGLLCQPFKSLANLWFVKTSDRMCDINKLTSCRIRGFVKVNELAFSTSSNSCNRLKPGPTFRLHFNLFLKRHKKVMTWCWHVFSLGWLLIGNHSTKPFCYQTNKSLVEKVTTKKNARLHTFSIFRR